MSETAPPRRAARAVRPAEAEKCLGCRLCQAACPVGARGFFQGRPEVGPGCRQCAACLEVCPAGVFDIPFGL